MTRYLLAACLLGASIPQVPAPLVWTKPDQFWFSKQVPGGHVWLNVDATHGVKEPLFDHQRLAIELTIRTGVEYTALALPFSDPAAGFVVKYDGSNAYIQEGAMAVEFNLGGQLWRCDLQTKWNWNKVPPTDYECLSRGAATAAPAKPGYYTESPDRKWNAYVSDHNVVVEPANMTHGPIQTLSKDGSPEFPYAAGSLRWSADSTKLSAYRVHADVWRSDSLTDSVKDKLKHTTFTIGLVTHEGMKR